MDQYFLLKLIISVFAANRTANVPGRIKFLIVSMLTIKGIRIGGVPWGT